MRGHIANAQLFVLRPMPVRAGRHNHDQPSARLMSAAAPYACGMAATGRRKGDAAVHGAVLFRKQRSLSQKIVNQFGEAALKNWIDDLHQASMTHSHIDVFRVPGSGHVLVSFLKDSRNKIVNIAPQNDHFLSRSKIGSTKHGPYHLMFLAR